MLKSSYKCGTIGLIAKAGVRKVRQVNIGKNDAGQRLDKFLAKSMPNLPQSLMHKFLRNKNIKLNGRKALFNEKLQEGDALTFYISDEFFEKDSKRQKTLDLSDERFNLSKDEIVYEDENIIIVDKPQGELVHPGDEQSEDGKSCENEESNIQNCLINRIMGYLFKKGEYVPEDENSFAPSLCHRLDRNTAGLIVTAKNAEALRIMNRKIKERSIKKTYLCAVHGVPEKKSALLKDFLYKDSSKKRVFVFPTFESAKRTMKIKYDDDIKSVVTKYSVVKQIGSDSVLRVELITGRTHQIRAHLAYIGHPIIGDGKYGISHGKNYGDNFQRLYAYSLLFKQGSDDGILSYLCSKEFFGSKYQECLKIESFEI